MPTLQALKPEIKEYQISSLNEIELNGVKYRNEFGLWVPCTEAPSGFKLPSLLLGRERLHL